jgi:hypothetical protein
VKVSAKLDVLALERMARKVIRVLATGTAPGIPPKIEKVS